MRFLTPAERGNNPLKQSVMPTADTLGFAVDREAGEYCEKDGFARASGSRVSLGSGSS